MDSYFWADLGATLFNSLVQASEVFLFSTGLALILGVLKILNFAHGAFFALGAYLAFTLLTSLGIDYGVVIFLLAVIPIAVIGGAIGAAVDKVMLQRVRNIDYHYSLIGTYALLLVTDGVIKVIWGVNYLALDVPREVSGALFLGDLILPSLSLMTVAISFTAFLALNRFLHHTDFGKTIQSVALDPWMANALGVNVPVVYAFIVVVSFALATAAGAVMSTSQAISPALAFGLALQSFAVLLVGGMGNVKGTFFAALILSTVDTFASTYLDITQGIVFFFAVIVILLVRPQGLFTGVHAV